ncbi:MAG: hypothetical protein KKB59_20235 [Spirochaetes bacterium]|nr:hypothetical protein [Spirochaetota bacterium]
MAKKQKVEFIENNLYKTLETLETVVTYKAKPLTKKAAGRLVPGQAVAVVTEEDGSTGYGIVKVVGPFFKDEDGDRVATVKLYDFDDECYITDDNESPDNEADDEEARLYMAEDFVGGFLIDGWIGEEDDFFEMDDYDSMSRKELVGEIKRYRTANVKDAMEFKITKSKSDDDMRALLREIEDEDRESPEDEGDVEIEKPKVDPKKEIEALLSASETMESYLRGIDVDSVIVGGRDSKRFKDVKDSLIRYRKRFVGMVDEFQSWSSGIKGNPKKLLGQVAKAISKIKVDLLPLTERLLKELDSEAKPVDPPTQVERYVKLRRESIEMEIAALNREKAALQMLLK